MGLLWLVSSKMVADYDGGAGGLYFLKFLHLYALVVQAVKCLAVYLYVLCIRCLV